MQTVLGVFVSIVLLIVLAWVAIFGGIGALLSRSRGGSVPAGLAWGTILGPIGWCAVLWTTRDVGPPAAPLESRVSGSYLSGPGSSSARPERWDPWNR